ncbi:MAG TPA: hypothetical protein VLB02_01880 [Candidatus Paceibacterota bacterium]|nr:hypothetical protein [Candidatus Paceibacterota bacterium]
MQHVAIMNKSWKLIPKILSKEKTIESRWYKTKRTPWGKIKPGEVIFFKNSGELVTAKAMVKKVLQFEIKHLVDAEKIVQTYGKEICIINKNPRTWGKLPKYCILMFLTNPQIVKIPFAIEKRGFGTGAAWLTVPNVLKLKKLE